MGLPWDTPNVLAAGSRLVDTGHADEVLALFTIIPPPTLVLLPTAVAEVLLRLIDACQASADPSRLHNLGAACSYAATLAFFNAAGGHERWCDLARSLPESEHTLLCETVPLAMHGDMQGGAALLGTVFDRYGDRLKPLWKADYLAMLALCESTFGHPDSKKHIKNASRSTGTTAARSASCIS